MTIHKQSCVLQMSKQQRIQQKRQNTPAWKYQKDT